MTYFKKLQSTIDTYSINFIKINTSICKDFRIFVLTFMTFKIPNVKIGITKLT